MKGLRCIQGLGFKVYKGFRVYYIGFKVHQGSRVEG